MKKLKLGGSVFYKKISRKEAETQKSALCVSASLRLCVILFLLNHNFFNDLFPQRFIHPFNNFFFLIKQFIF